MNEIHLEDQLFDLNEKSGSNREEQTKLHIGSVPFPLNLCALAPA